MISEPHMRNATLDGLLRRHLDPIEGGDGAWRGVLGAREVIVLTDEHHDRMRCMTLVAPLDDAPPALLRTLLEANFDRALDARYAIHGDGLWAVFLHPLSTLQPRDLEPALRQVVTLADNTGTTFASGGLVFGG